MDLGDFARRIRERGAQVERGASERAKTTALVADRDLVLATPVKTGRARSNWIVSLDTPSDEIVPASPDPQETIDQAEAALRSRAPEQEIFVTNNLPYIRRLNEGHSAQAPAGFVEKAILNAVQAGRRVKIFKS